jgi:hypothetical protein
MPHPEPRRREHAPPGSPVPARPTPEQAQAVTHGAGPLLLIAGPGAGKTRTLTHRIAYLRQSRGAASGSCRSSRSTGASPITRLRFARCSRSGTSAGGETMRIMRRSMMSNSDKDGRHRELGQELVVRYVQDDSYQP